MDSHRRSLLKTVSWRFVATITTGLVTFIFTGRLDLAITIGLGDSFIKLFIYYLHERAWTRVRFGQVRIPDYEI
jgi:adenylylsulfate kinase